MSEIQQANNMSADEENHGSKSQDMKNSLWSWQKIEMIAKGVAAVGLVVMGISWLTNSPSNQVEKLLSSAIKESVQKVDGLDEFIEVFEVKDVNIEKVKKRKNLIHTHYAGTAKVVFRAKKGDRQKEAFVVNIECDMKKQKKFPDEVLNVEYEMDSSEQSRFEKFLVDILPDDD